jgi:hypothetical protein
MTNTVIAQGYTTTLHGSLAAMGGLVVARHDWHGKALGPARYGANWRGAGSDERSQPSFCDAAISPSDVALG